MGTKQIHHEFRKPANSRLEILRQSRSFTHRYSNMFVELRVRVNHDTKVRVAVDDLDQSLGNEVVGRQQGVQLSLETDYNTLILGEVRKKFG